MFSIELGMCCGVLSRRKVVDGEWRILESMDETATWME